MERSDYETASFDSRFMALTQSQLIGNMAGLTGGAVFVSNPDTLSVCCNCSLKIEEFLVDRSEVKPPGVVSVEKHKLAGPISDNYTCKETWFNNIAAEKDGGDLIATMAVRADAFLGRLELLEHSNSSLRLSDHMSGHDLEPIFIQLVDAFESPAYGQPKMLVQVTADSPNVTLSGQLITKGEVVTQFGSIRLQARVNNSYNLTLSFVPSVLPNISIGVDVRDCMPGEILELGGELCVPCGEDLYSFDPRQPCRACPTNAKCGHSAVTPLANYWHSTSKSIQIHRCMTKGACDYKERGDVLEDQARNAHTHNLVLNYENGTTYRQCSKVRNLTECRSTL